MATRSSTFSIRLSVKDQAAASRALKNLGADGDKALTRVEKAARRNSAEFKRLQRSQRELTTGMQGLTRSLGPVGGALSALGPAGIAACLLGENRVSRWPRQTQRKGDDVRNITLSEDSHARARAALRDLGRQGEEAIRRYRARGWSPSSRSVCEPPDGYHSEEARPHNRVFRWLRLVP